MYSQSVSCDVCGVVVWSARTTMGGRHVIVNVGRMTVRLRGVVDGGSFTFCHRRECMVLGMKNVVVAEKDWRAGNVLDGGDAARGNGKGGAT